MPTTSTNNAAAAAGLSTTIEGGKVSLTTANPIQYVESYTVTLQNCRWVHDTIDQPD